MADTMHLSKEELIARAQADMERKLDAPEWTLRQKLALTAASCSTAGMIPGWPGRSRRARPRPGATRSGWTGL